MNMLFSTSRCGFSARYLSAYMNTTNKCVEVFYQISSVNGQTQLSIKVISEEQVVTVVQQTFVIVNDWKLLVATLPSGINRISVEGHRDEDDTGGCQISIDDLIVQDCASFGKSNS